MKTEEIKRKSENTSRQQNETLLSQIYRVQQAVLRGKLVVIQKLLEKQEKNLR